MSMSSLRETDPVSARAVLYAEDDENDVFFMQRAFAKARIEAQLAIVGDGREAVDYVLGRNGYADRERHPPPRLVILDLKMPQLNGLEALQQIRRDASLEALPVVFLTSSTQDSDVAQARAAGANGYFVKPSNAEELIGWVKALSQEVAVAAWSAPRRLEVPGNRL